MKLYTVDFKLTNSQPGALFRSAACRTETGFEGERFGRCFSYLQIERKLKWMWSVRSVIFRSGECGKQGYGGSKIAAISRQDGQKFSSKSDRVSI